MFDSLFPEAADTALGARFARPAAPAPEPGVFKNVASGTGKYFMRSMAEAGRAVSLVGAALPVAVDAIKGGTKEQDEYFAAHDAVFQRAVDYWTPKAGEVGVAGQVVGSLAGGLTQFFASAPLMVGTAMMSTSEDLVRQGVDADAALLAGDIAGLGTVAGIALPIVGKNLAQRVATGVAGNVGQAVAQAGATQAVLNVADAPADVVAKFDPFDAQNRSIDALMGLAFGAAAHVGARRPQLTPEQKDAVLLLNQARHLEQAATPGRPATPADLSASVRATKEAIEQILTGRPVDVAGEVRFAPDDAKAAWRAEAQQVVQQEMPPVDAPLTRPDMLDVTPERAPGSSAEDAPAPSAPRYAEDLRIPTGEFDPKTGEPTSISANDFVAKAEAEAAAAKSTAQALYMTAAECLLGAA